MGWRAGFLEGKVGLLGISYYAAGQWFVASMRPKYLGDFAVAGHLRFLSRPHASRRNLFRRLSEALVDSERTAKSVWRSRYNRIDIYTGERVTGPASLTPEELKANASDYLEDVLKHPLCDDFYKDARLTCRRSTFPP